MRGFPKAGEQQPFTVALVRMPGALDLFWYRAVIVLQVAEGTGPLLVEVARRR